ncbi:MAG: protein kinase [Planctomycetes bacterium]|nr:protein kinase [Planctomycetota bacterium]
MGLTAADVLERDGPLPVERVLEVVEALAQALKGLHRRDQAHGALSPGCVRLEPDGGVVLCDAGLARPHPTFAFLGEGERVGVPSFAAPEALDRGLVGPQADLYALGCLAWTLLSGAPPVDPQADPRELIERAFAPLPPLRVAAKDRLPPGLVPLLDNMAAADPRRRYAAVNDLLADLRAVRQGEAVRPIPPPPRVRAAHRGLLLRRPRLVGIALGSLALALAAALAAVVVLTRGVALEDPFEGYRFELEER